MKEPEARSAAELLRQARKRRKRMKRMKRIPTLRQGQGGEELLEELAFREGRLRKVRESKAALETESEGRAEVGDILLNEGTTSCTCTIHCAVCPSRMLISKRHS